MSIYKAVINWILICSAVWTDTLKRCNAATQKSRGIAESSPASFMRNQITDSETTFTFILSRIRWSLVVFNGGFRRLPNVPTLRPTFDEWARARLHKNKVALNLDQCLVDDFGIYDIKHGRTYRCNVCHVYEARSWARSMFGDSVCGSEVSVWVGSVGTLGERLVPP